MLSYQYSKALKHCENEIIEDLIVTDIIQDLRCSESFTLSDEEIILHEITSKAKAMKLLDLIQEKGDDAFEIFRDILRESNEEIADKLEMEINSDGRARARRNSITSCGEILIKGGVPDRSGSYIPRASIEKEILNLIESDHKKPILVHGILGCGKTSIVSNVLYSDKLFPDRFIRCCWMAVGNISENDVSTKLAILLKKLTYNQPDDKLVVQTSELLVENIKRKLYDGTTLLVIDDVQSVDIMKYFTFPITYIVTSRNSKLFSTDTAEMIEIPNKLDENDCTKLIQYFNIDDSFIAKIIQKTHQNPMYLTFVCRMIQTNSEYLKYIDDIDLTEEKILKECYNSLDTKYKKYYDMLVILQIDEIITIESLSIFWEINPAKALDIIVYLCNLNFLYKKWISEYNCNMYGVHNIHLEYLQSIYTSTKEEYKNLCINQFKNKYKSWCDIDISDPFFFMFYGKTLFDQGKFSDLSKLYSDFSFISAKIAICGISDLLRDYDRFRSPGLDESWSEFESFLMKYSHKFNKLPDNKDKILKIRKIFTMVIQLGLYEIKTSFTYKMAHKSRNLCKNIEFWDWKNPKPSLKIWESGDEIINLVDVNRHGILISSENGRLRLLEFNTGKCLFNYKISDNIILVKFINDLQFLIVDSNCNFWIFNFSDLNPKKDSLPDNKYLDEDSSDYDYERSPESFKSEIIDMFSYQEQFQKMLSNDFLKLCKSFTIINPKLQDGNLKVLLFTNEIVFLNVNDTYTYIALYDFQGRMANDFTVKFRIINLKPHSDGSSFYAMQDDTTDINLIDEFGETKITFSIQLEAIIDFTVTKNGIFCAVQNKIYSDTETMISDVHQQILFSEKNKLLSIDNQDANIQKLSISEENNLLALCLTNFNVQIWDYLRKEIMYSLKDSYFTDVYLQCDTNYLITTGQSNIAKWEISALSCIFNNNNNDNDNADCHTGSLYRSKFAMHNFNKDSFILILQSFKNDLEFCLYDNGGLTLELVHEDVKANCFTFYGNYLFIGLESGFIKIYNLKTYKKIYEIDCSYHIKEMELFKFNENIIVLVVETCNLTNKWMIFHLPMNELNDKLKLDKWIPDNLPSNIIRSKFFKSNDEQLTIGIIENNNCSLFIIQAKTCSLLATFILPEDIIDIDINDDGQYLCAIATTGQLKIWEINSQKNWDYVLETGLKSLRKCKFRPSNSSKWKTVAIINDNAEIYLYYFSGNDFRLNKITEVYPVVCNQLPQSLVWSKDSNFLFIADYDICKWKIPFEPRENKYEIKLPLTKLQTYFGGINFLFTNGSFICTVDQQGFLYVFKKME